MSCRTLVWLCACLAAGCRSPAVYPWGAAPVAAPLFVQTANEEAVWERTVDVLHDFQFQLAREDRLARVIETEYKVGSGCLEPWHKESVGWENRLESTLQSVRRKVRVSLVPGDRGGGYVVAVEAFKELEDLPGIAGNSPGAATFLESAPLQRDLNPVVGQSTPSGWIPVGRDPALEQALLVCLRSAYSG